MFRDAHHFCLRAHRVISFAFFGLLFSAAWVLDRVGLLMACVFIPNFRRTDYPAVKENLSSRTLADFFLTEFGDRDRIH